MSYAVSGLPEPEEVPTWEPGDPIPILGPSLYDVIREAIRTDGRSQRAIAQAVGLHPTDISRFVRGLQGLSMISMQRLCDLLGLVLVRSGIKR